MEGLRCLKCSEVPCSSLRLLKCIRARSCCRLSAEEGEDEEVEGDEESSGEDEEEESLGILNGELFAFFIIMIIIHLFSYDK